MLAAFAILIMAIASNSDGPENPHHQRSGSVGGRCCRKGSAEKTAGRKTSWSRPRPTHFLSVRIDNPLIWEKVAAVQHDIIEDHAHLQGAAIPVQDLHLTLFIATLHEEDGSLEQARETLEGCHDILRHHGLLASSALDDNGDEHPADPVSSRAIEETTSNVGQNEKAGDDATRPSEADSTRSLASMISPPPTPTPLLLAFQGLGNFNDKVLYARLVEDDQASRFRSLTSALHTRFSQARLLGEASPPPTASTSETSNAGIGENVVGDVVVDKPSEFVFEPHLTVMKTSKLKNRKTEIPPSSYAGHADSSFGSHAPTAVELSSMEYREETPDMPEGFEPREYYKCEHRLALPSARHGADRASMTHEN